MTEEKKVEEKPVQIPAQETAYVTAHRLGTTLGLAKIYQEISQMFENTSVTIKVYGRRLEIYLGDDICVQCTDNHCRDSPYTVWIKRRAKYLPGQNRYMTIGHDTVITCIKKYAQMYM